MTAQAHIFTGTEISTGRRKPSEIVAEYDAKREALAGALAEFEAAGTAIKSAATHSAGADPSAKITISLGPASMSMPTVPNTWRLASVTQAPPGPTIRSTG